MGANTTIQFVETDLLLAVSRNFVSSFVRLKLSEIFHFVTVPLRGLILRQMNPKTYSYYNGSPKDPALPRSSRLSYLFDLGVHLRNKKIPRKSLKRRKP
jgi:hypothetical protein